MDSPAEGQVGGRTSGGENVTNKNQQSIYIKSNYFVTLSLKTLNIG